ncbi:hypothetical protein PsorP6_001719 [Peronosclerospora sorghi]|uniref:Uncharacterized protein n=1 Tax=Peronosclerospora sorghi TaxID=230839 RepID=A0ACC0WQL5_9STRA|nr:hypothetical protein PsorP6_001719 [Peronosclerospora sorghi]
MEQRNDRGTGRRGPDAHALASYVESIQLHLETRTVSPTSVAPSPSSFRPHTLESNMAFSSPSSSLYDALPQLEHPAQRSTSALEIERRSSVHAAAPQGFDERRTSTAVDPPHVVDDAEASRPRLAPLSTTPRSGETVRARLLQALPQWGIGHFFNTQIPPWRGLVPGRQEGGETEGNETGRLLEPEDERIEHRPRPSSGLLAYAVSSNGDAEPRAPQPPTTETDPDEPSRRGPRTAEESEDQTAMDELQSLFRRCHNSLPFLALFVIYFAYQHATGILVFVVGTFSVMGLDQRMRAQIALKDKVKPLHLVSIITMCAVDMVAICSLDGEPNPLFHFSVLLQPKPSSDPSSRADPSPGSSSLFWRVLWTVLVNDFLIRLWSIVLKALIAGAKSDRFQCECKPRDEASHADDAIAVVLASEDNESTAPVMPLTQQVVSTVAFYRRKRKLYGIIEMCSIFLRSLLASIPWCTFYQLCASTFMADVFTFAYLFIKGLILAAQGRRIFKLARSFVTLGLEFGVYVSHEAMVEAGCPDCSICYESMHQPVQLACTHMFCEECVTEWFDHERSCPLCRANVDSSGATEAVKPQFLDGRTSLVPQLL